jgi:uncharacterized protein
MKREDLLLAALSPAKGDFYTPVQVQKLLFLLDREIPDLIGGQHFNFQPYNYGPFDKAVYMVLESLSLEGMVEINEDAGWKRYRLTPLGQEKGNGLFETLDGSAKNYITKVSDFVRRLPFTELVRSIYKAYPEMKVNSVFR